MVNSKGEALLNVMETMLLCASNSMNLTHGEHESFWVKLVAVSNSSLLVLTSLAMNIFVTSTLKLHFGCSSSTQLNDALYAVKIVCFTNEHSALNSTREYALVSLSAIMRKTPIAELCNLQ